MAKTTYSVEAIDVVKELKHQDIAYTNMGDGEVNVLCPFHDDDSPSLGINTEKRIFNCRAAQCKAKGNFVYYLAKVKDVSPSEMWAELEKRHNVKKLPSINQETIEAYHQAMLHPVSADAKECRKALAARGITDDLVEEYKIGYHSVRQRVCIPVFVGDRVVNVRYYRPGLRGPSKFFNHYKKGANRLFNARTLEHDSVWICGGELKAMVVYALLKDKCIGAVSATSGEGNWDRAFNRDFVGKSVYICMDIDAAGEISARQLADSLRKDNVFIIHLPLDKAKYPKGDISDYVGQEGATQADLLKLMEDAEHVVWEPGTIVSDNSAVQEVQLGSIEKDSSLIGKSLLFEGVMNFSDMERYFFPETIKVECARSTEHCMSCGVFGLPKPTDTHTTEVKCSPCDPTMLNWKDSSSRFQEQMLRDICKIPVECDKHSISVSNKQFGHSALLSPIIRPADDDPSYDTKHALIVGVDVQPNKEYSFRGTVQADPASQKVRVMVSAAREINTFNLDLTPEDLEALEIFRPVEWTEKGLSDKLKEIYHDLSVNVTMIYGRPELHFAFDLTQFSPVWLRFRKRKIKGWVNSVIVGDSGQGKSEVSLALLDYYGVGGRVDCKNATFSGLVAGLIKNGSEWFVSWGALPRYDRSHVVFEECHGTPIEVIARMTDVRSRGLATVEKIHKRSALARTRLTMIANPRWNKTVGNFLCGVEAIRELIGAPEDIRRFDFGLVVSKNDVSRDEIERGEAVETKHRFTSELSRNLLCIAWNQSENDIYFADEVYQRIRVHGSELIKEFECDVLLVDSTTIEHKIARMSCALAARTYSYEEGILYVRTCHVDYVVRTLRKLYKAPAMRYDEYAKNARKRNTIGDITVVINAIGTLPNSEQFVSNILIHEKFGDNLLQDWTGLDRDDFAAFRSKLVTNRCIEQSPNPRFYVKTESFIPLLAELKTSKNLKNENPF